MEDGRVADYQLSASTYISASRRETKARLNGISQWCSLKVDNDQFVRVSLQLNVGKLASLHGKFRELRIISKGIKYRQQISNSYKNL